jgi:ferredoxin
MLSASAEKKGLSFVREACLPFGKPAMSCKACADLCPQSAIDLDSNGFAIGNACNGCGRCAALCPTSALRFEDIQPNPALLCARSEIVVECVRVPATLSADAETRVPCLGAFGVTALLSWVDAAQGRPIVLVDRGWCASCPSHGGDSHPLKAALAEVELLLGRLNTGKSLAPRLVFKPVPVQHRIDAFPEGKTSRRGFLRALASGGASEEWNDGTGTPSQAGDRVRRWSLLSRLAARHRQTLNAGLFPSLAVGGACQGHGVCAAVCPTGALRLNQQEEKRTLKFEAPLCLACRQCEASCPEGALAIAPRGNAMRALAWADFELPVLQSCPQCGASYSGGKESSRCPACEKRDQLGRMGFGLTRGGLDVPHVI